MATLNIDDIWSETFVPKVQGTKVVKLNTADKYLDRDIWINIGGMNSGTSATIATSVSGTNPTVTPSGTATGFTASASATSYYVSCSGTSNSQTFTGKYTSTAGYLPTVSTATSAGSNATKSVSATIGTAAKVYIPTASVTYSGGAPSIKSGSTTTATGSNLTITDTDTDPGSGVYLTTGGSATATRSAIQYTNSTTGILPAQITATNVSTIGSAKDGSATALTTNKYYATGVTLNKGKWFDFTNAVTETVRTKYNSDTNAIDFIFA